MTAEERFWVTLSAVPDANVWRFAKWYFTYRTRERFWQNIGEHGVEPFDEDAAFRRVQERLERNNAHVILYDNDRFPSRLKTIPSPPAILYWIGDLALAEEKSVAVIGSRRYSAYGAECARFFASSFARYGLCVISGMADGIDGCAQRKALEDGGKTIAVLAGGIDHVYPAGNRDLYEMIAQNGLILSESPPGVKPVRPNFPYRNRLISGLSDGVMIVEAAASSGTMSTVEHALEQNKAVYAVPGNIFSPLCAGTNRLIKDGCFCVTEPEDILEACGISASPAKKEQDPVTDPSLDEVQRGILRLLEDGPLYFDDLLSRLGLSADECNLALTMLEISGYIQKEAGRQYKILSR